MLNLSYIIGKSYTALFITYYTSSYTHMHIYRTVFLYSIKTEND